MSASNTPISPPDYLMPVMNNGWLGYLPFWRCWGTGCDQYVARPQSYCRWCMGRPGVPFV